MFLFFSSVILSQSGENSTINPKLPDFTPPSAESYSFTKYGNLPVGEFLGNLNLNIPIYNYKANKIDLPITLSYNGSGLRVDEHSTKTGVTWVLNAGGVITRTIKDKPDEQTKGLNTRIQKTVLQFNELNTPDGSAGATTLASYIEDNNYDSEVDIFNYNFMGYSGSFILDENYNPLLVNEETELKISIIGDLRNEREFLVTTPDGVKFYFGGVNAVERTFNNSNDNSSPIADVGYYLTKIIHPDYGEIFFEYVSTSGLLELGRSESKTFLTHDNFPDQCLDAIKPSIGVNYTTQFQKIQYTRLISKIYSNCNNEVIDFLYLNLNGRKVLENIEISNNINNTYQLLNRIKFEYIGLDTYTPNKRFFLSKVLFNDEISGNEGKKLIWSFEYDDPFGLPDRFSYSVDEYGYYNGKINNGRLPRVHIPHQYNYANNYVYPGADKSADFNFAKKGALVKVNFPTKGFSSIEYESNPFKKDVYEEYENYFNSSENTYSATIPGFNNLSEENISIAPVFKDQRVKISYQINSNNFNANHILKTNVKITNISDNIIIYNTTANIGMQSLIKEFEIDLYQGKLYKFEITNINPSDISPGTYVSAFLRFKLLTDVTTTQGDGIRVKRVIDYDKNNSQVEYKRFYYLPTNLINKPIHLQPIKYPPTNKYFNYSMIWKTRPEACYSEHQDVLDVYEARYTTLMSNSLSDYFNNNGFSNIVNSVVVTSFGGDNFELGGVERIYYTDNSYTIYGSRLSQNFNALNNFDTGIAGNDFSNSISNNSSLSGDLIKEYYFKKSGDLFYKLKQINKNYQKTKTSSYINFVGKKVFDIVLYPEENPYQPNTTTSNYFLKQYATLTFRNKLESVEEIEYFEDVQMPVVTFTSGMENDDLSIEIDEPNESDVKKITKFTNYTYGNLKGLPIETTNSTSETGVLDRTVNTYIDTANALTGIPSSQLPIYTELMQQNRVNSPIESQGYKNNELLFTQRNLYKNFTIGSDSKILLEKIQSTKGSLIASPLEDKVIFYNYDTNYNPAVMGPADGPKTRYIYNNEGLIVAKIENYTGTDTIFPIVTGNLDNSNCSLQNLYANSLVTVYHYDLTINKLIRITNASCVNTYYEYDSLQRLKYIKDHDGNILQEFDTNFKNN
jgi:hypothetical protein